MTRTAPAPAPRLGLALTAVLLALTACGAGARTQPKEASPGTQPSTATEPSASATRPTRNPNVPRISDRPIVGAAAPSWLGTRVLPRTADGFGEIRPTPRELVRRRFTLPDTVAPLPGRGFAARITNPAPASVIARSTWRSGCPVAATDLSWVRVTFRGFEGGRHTGELLVSSSAADSMVSVFRQLYAARFPIEEMRVTRADESTRRPRATETTPVPSTAADDRRVVVLPATPTAWRSTSTRSRTPT